MWDLPRPGLEPVSPALAGRFLTTVPPGKPIFILKKIYLAHVFNADTITKEMSEDEASPLKF